MALIVKLLHMKKEYDYFRYVLGTEPKDCKNYFEKVNLRFAKSITDFSTAKHLKFHLYLNYYCIFNFLFFLWSNFDFEVEKNFNIYMSFINDWFGNIINFLVMISVLPGGILSAILSWCIVRSLLPEK